MEGHRIQIGDREWLFNAIDPIVVCDHLAEVTAALTGAAAGLQSFDGEGMADAWAAFAKALSPARINFHRTAIFARAMVDGVEANKALMNRKITPYEANAGLMEGLLYNYRPFSVEGVRFLGQLAAGVSSASTTSHPGSPSGASSSSE